jgi:hypothetical protein
MSLPTMSSPDPWNPQRQARNRVVPMCRTDPSPTEGDRGRNEAPDATTPAPPRKTRGAWASGGHEHDQQDNDDLPHRILVADIVWLPDGKRLVQKKGALHLAFNIQPSAVAFMRAVA